MPEPQRLAIRVDGHLVQAESVEDLLAKLRALGKALDFEVADNLVITFAPGTTATSVERGPGST